MFFVNHTNHPSAKWSKEQLAAAAKYGEIRDLPFPAIDPLADKKAVAALAADYAAQIAAMNPAAVLCQGEFTYTFALVKLLQERALTVLSATSERIVGNVTQEDGTEQKISLFRFVAFREY